MSSKSNCIHILSTGRRKSIEGNRIKMVNIKHVLWFPQFYSFLLHLRLTCVAKNAHNHTVADKRGREVEIRRNGRVSEVFFVGYWPACAHFTGLRVLNLI